MAVQDERPTAAAAALSGDQLGAPGEVESRWNERFGLQRLRARLEDLHFRAGRAQALSQIPLQPGFIPRRIADLGGGRVDRDQGAGQRHELIATGRDLIAHASLAARRRRGAKRNTGSRMDGVSGIAPEFARYCTVENVRVYFGGCLPTSAAP